MVNGKATILDSSPERPKKIENIAIVKAECYPGIAHSANIAKFVVGYVTEFTWTPFIIFHILTGFVSFRVLTMI